jgi:hypothetical protein
LKVHHPEIKKKARRKGGGGLRTERPHSRRTHKRHCFVALLCQCPSKVLALGSPGHPRSLSVSVNPAHHSCLTCRGLPPAVSSALTWYVKHFFSFKFGDMAEKQTFLYMLPYGKAGKALKQANSETKGAFKASCLARDTTFITQWPRRASHAPRKAVTRKQAALQTTRQVNSVKLLRFPTWEYTERGPMARISSQTTGAGRL